MGFSGGLSTYRNGLSRALRIRLVSSLIFPIFDYCAAIFSDLTGQRFWLRRLINACVRFIFDLCRDDHVSHLYDLLNWLSDDRRTFLSCCLIYSILCSSIPPYIASYFRPYSNSRKPSCSSISDLAVFFCRTSTYQRSFLSAAPLMWNSLPPHQCIVVNLGVDFSAMCDRLAPLSK